MDFLLARKSQQEKAEMLEVLIHRAHNASERIQDKDELDREVGTLFRTILKNNRFIE